MAAERDEVGEAVGFPLAHIGGGWHESGPFDRRRIGAFDLTPVIDDVVEPPALGSVRGNAVPHLRVAGNES